MPHSRVASKPCQALGAASAHRLVEDEPSLVSLELSLQLSLHLQLFSPEEFTKDAEPKLA